jgi:hypothetical protein
MASLGLKQKKRNLVMVVMPIIPATQKAEAEGVQIPGQLG